MVVAEHSTFNTERWGRAQRFQWGGPCWPPSIITIRSLLRAWLEIHCLRVYIPLERLHRACEGLTLEWLGVGSTLGRLGLNPARWISVPKMRGDSQSRAFSLCSNLQLTIARLHPALESSNLPDMPTKSKPSVSKSAQKPLPSKGRTTYCQAAAQEGEQAATIALSYAGTQ
jgi:hypothetical protein